LFSTSKPHHRWMEPICSLHQAAHSSSCSLSTVTTGYVPPEPQGKCSTSPSAVRRMQPAAGSSPREGTARFPQVPARPEYPIWLRRLLDFTGATLKKVAPQISQGCQSPTF